MTGRVLFVCAGNTCRSPIAATLATTILPEVVAESAGTMPGPRIADKAISVVKEMTGRDISEHRPRDLAVVDLSSFDHLVALDRMVGEDLEPVLPSDVTLVVWHVPDPYGGSLGDYRQCAKVLQHHIQELGRQWVQT